MPRKRDNPEEKIHATVVDYVRLVAPAILLFHPANGGSRHIAEAANLKKLGVQPGIFDLQLYLPGGRIACIEVKAPGGVLSDDQEAVARELTERSIPWAVVTGAKAIEQTRAFLRTLDVPMREAA